MTITRQKIQSALRKAGYSRSEFHRSGMVRGWGEWSAGTEVKTHNDTLIVSYNFGVRNATEGQRIKQLQALQNVLLAADIDCYPNTEETHLIIGDSNA